MALLEMAKFPTRSVAARTRRRTTATILPRELSATAKRSAARRSKMRMKVTVPLRTRLSTEPILLRKTSSDLFLYKVS